jgi:hypothetical protein
MATPALRFRSNRIRLGAVIAVGLAVAFVVWLVLARDSGDSSNSAQTATVAELKPELVSRDELQDLAAESDTPLYWAGARDERNFEVTRTSGGTTYVRYLRDGMPAGDLEPQLTVVTYSLPNALARLRAGRSGRMTRIPLQGGGLAVVDPSRPTNVHLAYPGQPVQVEVFAPEPGLARRLVEAGAVRPL